MIRLFFFSVGFLVFWDLSSQIILWDDPIPVSLETQDNNRPRLTLDAEGNPLVIWGKDGERAVYFSRWNGNSFEDGYNLLPENVQAFTADWAGPEIDSYGDKVAMVFKRYPEDIYGVYLMLSEDGGITWSDTLRADGLDLADHQTRFGQIEVGEDGTLHLGFMQFINNYQDPEYMYRKSSDSGASWSEIQNVSTEFFGNEACDCCTADLAADGQDVVMIYRNNASNLREIKAVASSNGGESFDVTIEPDNSGTVSNTCFSSGPSSEIKDGKLYSAFKAISGTQQRARFTVTNLSTGEVEFEQNIHDLVQGNVRQNNAQMAMDGEFTVVVWENALSTANEVMYSFSTGDLNELLVGQDTVNVEISGRQINPDVALFNDVVHVVWQDNGNDRVMYRRGVIDPDGVGINESLLEEIMIYPNPAVSHFFIDVPGPANLMLYDLNGKLLRTEELRAGQNTIQVSNLPEGLYFIRADRFPGGQTIVIGH